MVNHLRTLLLNRNGATVIPDNHAEEYVPETYRAVPLPSGLQRVRRELFGHEPDVVGMNYRLRQFAAILHAPDIEPYTLAEDSRVTYWPGDDVCFSLPTGLVVAPLQGEVQATLLGEVPPSRSGRLRWDWHVDAYEDDRIDIEPRQTPNQGFDAEVTWSDGLSAPIELPGVAPLAFRLGGGVILAGTRFDLSLYARHAVQLAELPGRLGAMLTGTTLSDLFGDGSGDYGVFRRWWQESDQLTYQLGGVLLALAKRTDDIRKRR